jgi:hypothetical protein
MAVTPGVPSDASHRERRWFPVVVVTLLLVVVAEGARSVADATVTGAGPVMLGNVRVQPQPGWQLESPATATFVRLHKGPVVLDVSVGGPVPGGPVLLATLYRERGLEPAFAQFSQGFPESGVLPNGAPVVRFPYVGVTGDGIALEGLVWAVDTQDTSVVFDARAPSGELAGALDDIRTMIEGATL